MIRTECVVFAAMLLAGSLAGLAAAFFFLLGKGSKPARALFDFLAPLVVGGIFFVVHLFVADGVFRLYAVAAFVIGLWLSRALLRRYSPFLRRVAKKWIIPIKSLAYALEDRVSARFAPFLRWRREKRERRQAKRAAARKARAESRAAKRDDRRAKRWNPPVLEIAEGERTLVDDRRSGVRKDALRRIKRQKGGREGESRGQSN